jgi:hypothetical protein
MLLSCIPSLIMSRTSHQKLSFQQILSRFKLSGLSAALSSYIKARLIYYLGFISLTLYVWLLILPSHVFDVRVD